jgi:hypothetical protein
MIEVSSYCSAANRQRHVSPGPRWKESEQSFGVGWIVIGGRRDVMGNPGTLDGYLKDYMKRDTAGWVAALLESAGVVELERGRPGRMRVRA